jgi:hypothetical protein
MDPLTVAAMWGAILIGIAALVGASRSGRLTSGGDADLTDDQWPR